jgi:hypothetical protein
MLYVLKIQLLLYNHYKSSEEIVIVNTIAHIFSYTIDCDAVTMDIKLIVAR